MRLSVVSIAGLRERLGEQAFWQRTPAAVTRVRALAHVANPRARDEDVALIVAEEGPRLVGYIGALSDRLHATDPPRPLSWTSTWWVAPEARDTGAGALLLYRLLKSCGYALGVSSYSVRAGRFLEASRDFMPLRELAGLQIQCGLRPVDLPGRLRRVPTAARLAELALPAVRGVGAQQLRAWLRRHAADAAVTVEYVNSIDPEAAALVERHNARDLTRRGREELDWLLQHPWHLEAKLPDRTSSDYHFLKTCPQFRIDGIKVFGPDGRLIGVLVLTLRDGMLTVPYAFCAPGDALAVLTVVVRHALADQVAVLELFEEELVAAARGSGLTGLRRRDITRRSLISSRLRPIDLAAWRLRAGDGDRAFY